MGMRTWILAFIGFWPINGYAQKEHIKLHCRPCLISDVYDTVQKYSGVRIITWVSRPDQLFWVGFDIRDGSALEIVRTALRGHSYHLRPIYGEGKLDTLFIYLDGLGDKLSDAIKKLP
jgi:hypothetical protein